MFKNLWNLLQKFEDCHLYFSKSTLVMDLNNVKYSREPNCFITYVCFLFPELSVFNFTAIQQWKFWFDNSLFWDIQIYTNIKIVIEYFYTIINYGNTNYQIGIQVTKVLYSVIIVSRSGVVIVRDNITALLHYIIILSIFTDCQVFEIIW